MEKRTTQSIPFHEGHEHLRKVNRSIRPAFGSRNNVSGCFLSVALEAFSITTNCFILIPCTKSLSRQLNGFIGGRPAGYKMACKR